MRYALACPERKSIFERYEWKTGCGSNITTRINHDVKRNNAFALQCSPQRLAIYTALRTVARNGQSWAWIHERFIIDVNVRENFNPQTLPTFNKIEWVFFFI